jgi:hypothetical protein
MASCSTPWVSEEARYQVQRIERACALAVALCSTVGAGNRLAAQRLTDSRHYDSWHAELTPHTSRQAPAALSAAARDYRWEGLALGGVAIGITGGVIGHALCSEGRRADESCVGSTVAGALFGAVVGGVTGGLLGGVDPI